MTGVLVNSLLFALVAQAPVATGTTAASADTSTVAAPAAPVVSAQVAKDGDDKGQTWGPNPLMRDPDKGRPWQVTGRIEFLTPVVTDEDPANDRQLRYQFGGGLRLFAGGTAFFRFGWEQRFVTTDDESAFQFQDMNLGLRYVHSFDIAAIDRKLTWVNTGLFWLPTSLDSQQQDLILAPEWRTFASMNVIGGLSINPNGFFRYQWHEFAEQQSGSDGSGGMNTQLAFGMGLNAQYDIWDFGKFGSIAVGADLSVGWDKSYPSSEDFESEASSTTYWGQDWGWDVYLLYVPLPYLTTSIAMVHGAPTVRNGVTDFDLFDREETRFSFAVAAQY